MLERVQVLIVDDNRQMLLLLRSVMRAFGLGSVTETEDAASALELMKGRPFDLIITDFAMRPIDGIEFCRMLRTAPDSPNPYIPVIMITGHADRRRVADARDAGVSSFLVKPVSARQLAAHINAAAADNRPFVRSRTFFGPDRRQGPDPNYHGPKRRAADREAEALDLDFGPLPPGSLLAQLK